MYGLLKDDIYGVLSSPAWINTGYRTYPTNYSGKIDTSKNFIRVSILPGKPSLDAYSFKKTFSGLLILSVFVKAGEGDKTLFAIADTIDSFFEGKTLTNGTQFGPSTLSTLGLDPADNTLYRGDYSIQFKAYGE